MDIPLKGLYAWQQATSTVSAIRQLDPPQATGRHGWYGGLGRLGRVVGHHNYTVRTPFDIDDNNDMSSKAKHRQSGDTHEQLVDRTETRLGSERSFGIVFAVVFAIIGLLPLLRSHTPFYWSFGVAAVFLLAAFLAPWALAPLNRLWFRFGLLLHTIISPLIMGLLFYLVVTPTGLMMRLFRKDLLRLKFDPAAESYWIKRDPPGPARGSFDNQF